MKMEAEEIWALEVQLISYFVNTSWIEPTLKKLKECLDSETCPEHAQTGFGYKGDQPCEYCRYSMECVNTD